jgi:hypothetical protein
MTFGKASRLILAVAGMAANFAPATVIESFDCEQFNEINDWAARASRLCRR